MDTFEKRKETIGDLKAIEGALRLLQIFLDDEILKRDIGKFTYVDTYVSACKYALTDIFTARERLIMAESALKCGLPKET